MNTSKNFEHEIDEEVAKLSDTEILMNFNKAIKAIYPYLIKIQAYAYDAWDNIIDHLFERMVYETFQYKYGININPKERLGYDYMYNGQKHYIQCIPRAYPIEAMLFDDWCVLSKDELAKKTIIFTEFGDGVHFLTGGLAKEEAYKVSFDLVEIQIMEQKIPSDPHQRPYFLRIEDLEFKFI